MITKLQANHDFETGKDENLRIQIGNVPTNVHGKGKQKGAKEEQREWGIKVSGCKLWLVSTLV